MALMIQSMVGPPPADAGVINVGLAVANARAARIMLPEPLTVTIREGPDGRVVAGLRGTFIADGLHATEMWVAEEDRGAGLGAEVMAEAESVAMRRRCVGVHLDAFDSSRPASTSGWVTKRSGWWRITHEAADASTCRSALFIRPVERGDLPLQRQVISRA